MATYRNKFRLSHVWLSVKNSMVALFRGDVPTYIVVDVMNRLNKGEQEIIIPMCGDGRHKSLVRYLNEYHGYINKVWTLEFLHYVFMFTTERVNQKLGNLKDIDIEILEFSDTDKRVVINIKPKGE